MTTKFWAPQAKALQPLDELKEHEQKQQQEAKLNLNNGLEQQPVVVVVSFASLSLCFRCSLVFKWMKATAKKHDKKLFLWLALVQKVKQIIIAKLATKSLEMSRQLTLEGNYRLAVIKPSDLLDKSRHL